jgi:hypothetical protein
MNHPTFGIIFKAFSRLVIAAIIFSDFTASTGFCVFFINISLMSRLSLNAILYVTIVIIIMLITIYLGISNVTQFTSVTLIPVHIPFFYNPLK